jgi:hypothetical protein
MVSHAVLGMMTAAMRAGFRKREVITRVFAGALSSSAVTPAGEVRMRIVAMISLSNDPIGCWQDALQVVGSVLRSHMFERFTGE